MDLSVTLMRGAQSISEGRATALQPPSQIGKAPVAGHGTAGEAEALHWQLSKRLPAALALLETPEGQLFYAALQCKVCTKAATGRRFPLQTNLATSA